jgi:hypothetical protein
VSPTLQTLLETPSGFASREVARFLWQFDEQTRRLHLDLDGIGVDELRWQPHPGMNTIGMLLAHLAVAETHLVQVGLLQEPAGHVHDVLGITEEDEGMPLAEGAPPSPALDGRDLAWFLATMARARAHTRDVAQRLTDADVEGIVTRPPRPDGTVRVFNRGWVLYHILEHQAGHHAQILLLRHLFRLRSGA